MENTIEVTIPGTDPVMNEILVALLLQAGYDAFEEERSVLKAYIGEQTFNQAQLDEVTGPRGLSATIRQLAPQNWNANWESGFSPVEVPGFCMVRAGFHPAPKQDIYDLVITPKMSFGTGHHATTFQMLSAMQPLSFTGKSVLDFGTGTGVLAILAEKLGAATVLAIDNDDWSIENAAENVQLNNCRNVELAKADHLPGGRKFDIILANINRNVIMANLPALAKSLVPGGVLLISGLLQADAADLEKAIQSASLSLTEKREKESWLCWTLKA
ncbi:MAG: 50S ribosomal protein L11 methyltransferase [Flavihumibacter sp.]